MTVELSCPKCHFSRTVPPEKIPKGARWATCPRCKHRFEFSPVGSVSGFEQQEQREKGESGLKRGTTPWENRGAMGLWQGIYQTFKAVLFSPDEFFGTMPSKGGIKEPLAFGLLLGSIGTMFGFFWNFLMMSGGLIAVDNDLTGQFSATLIFFGMIIISPLLVMITMIVFSAVLHLLLLIVRGGKNGFEATFRVVSYSQATQVLGLIPFIGGIIGGLWNLIVQIIGLKRVHETSYLRVFMALLIPVALIFLGTIAMIIALITFSH